MSVSKSNYKNGSERNTNGEKMREYGKQKELECLPKWQKVQRK